jgi:hypothetical protein
VGSSRAQLGQATVEAALTLPLALFLVLGGLQVFLTLQARLMAQYAVARAAHVGASNFGDCQRMNHAAILSLMPTFTSFIGPGTPGGSPEEKLANGFAMRRSDHYAGSGNVGDGTPDFGYNGPIVWIYRESPLAADVQGMPTGQLDDFDTPGKASRLEVRMVFWYPLHVPFANWVFARAVMAQWGVEDYVASNPLMTANANVHWAANAGGFSPQAATKQEMLARAQVKQWVFPISVSYTTRMMTPADVRYFGRQNCWPVP